MTPGQGHPLDTGCRVRCLSDRVRCGTESRGRPAFAPTQTEYRCRRCRRAGPDRRRSSASQRHRRSPDADRRGAPAGQGSSRRTVAPQPRRPADRRRSPDAPVYLRIRRPDTARRSIRARPRRSRRSVHRRSGRSRGCAAARRLRIPSSDGRTTLRRFVGQPWRRSVLRVPRRRCSCSTPSRDHQRCCRRS